MKHYVILGPYTRDEFHKWFRDRDGPGRIQQVIPMYPQSPKGHMYEVLVELSESEEGKIIRGQRKGDSE